MFEDFNDDITINQSHGWSNFLKLVHTQDIIFGKLIAFKSRSLEQFSMSFMVEASDFFGACEQEWTWKHLESLALTSRLLQYGHGQERAYSLLYKAGVAALRMPKLQNMPLWYGGRGEACAFLYHMDNGRPTITCRGTWDLVLKPDVIRIWEEVASKFQLFGLRIKTQRVQACIDSHGDAIYHLNLPPGIVDPVSLWQIRREGRVTSE